MWGCAAELGLWGTLGTVLMSYGLENTTALRASLLLGVINIMVPLISALGGEPVGRLTWLAAGKHPPSIRTRVVEPCRFLRLPDIHHQFYAMGEMAVRRRRERLVSYHFERSPSHAHTSRREACPPMTGACLVGGRACAQSSP